MTQAMFARLCAPLVAADLTLRALCMHDRSALARAFDEDELWTWMLVDKPRSSSDVEAWIERALAGARERSEVPFVAELPGGGLVATSRYLDVREIDRGLEIGWTMLFARARGSWINGRTKLLLLERAFEAGFARVQLKTDARNARSRAAIAAIGATFEGVLRAYQRRADGTQRDTAIFSIVAPDWPGVRGQLERRTAARKETT